MGPNGSGKSTLSHILAGRDGYTITSGEVAYEGEDLLKMLPEHRAHRGIFLAFQYPVEIPGVSTKYFLRAAVNARREHRGLEELEAYEFLKMVKEKVLSEDMEHHGLDEVQKLTNSHIQELDMLTKQKEKEILEV